MKKSISKLAYLLVSAFYISGAPLIATEYEIKDIGTLQTYSSAPIAINNKGEILGSYLLNSPQDERRIFLRDENGSFLELPLTVDGINVNWKYLTNNSVVYGTYLPSTHATLFMWDSENGGINLGDLPGREIAAINDAGQVLIKSISEVVDGKLISYPVIWNNGEVVKLKGLEGDVGISSEEASGLDMNNNGDVVGYSSVSLIYKNTIYKQRHATKWVQGQAIDLHNEIPKSVSSEAIAISNKNDVLISTKEGGKHLLRQDGGTTHFSYDVNKLSDDGYIYNYNYDYGRPLNPDSVGFMMYDRYKNVVCADHVVNDKIQNDSRSIWMKIFKIISVNERREIIAEAKTVYGEWHALLLSPIVVE